MFPVNFTFRGSAISAHELARMRQSAMEKGRLIRHQKIAFDLATMPADQSQKLINDAKAIVLRWHAENLCSSVYIEMWERILFMNPVEMAETMVSDMDGWGTALCQNSPWVGLHA